MLKNFKSSILAVILVVVALWILSIYGALRFFGKVPSPALENGKVLEKQRVVEEESTVINVVEAVSPSVVSIAVENSPSINFFGIPQEGDSTQSGIGTGFVVSSSGLIITNKHVVSSDSEKYTAIISDNGQVRELEVKEINRDPFNDLAILRVDASDLKPVELGDSDSLKVGQRVIAIGNALGRFQNTVTVGVVSGLGRGVTPFDPSTGIAERLDDLVQTDAAINPGNSGGPLVNIAGQVIGEFTKSGGKISRPFLGVRYSYISQNVALLNDVPQGELIREVVDGSSADRAGIKIGDIVVEFDGQKLTEENAMQKIIRGKNVGDRVSMKVFRNGSTFDVEVTLGEAPNE